MTLADRAGGVALWRQIAETLAAEIRARDIAPGARLPTEPALAARFGVNRHTVRRAITELRERGLVRIEQGRGTFACAEMLDYPLSGQPRFTESLARQRRVPGGRLLAAATVPADAAVAARLELAEATLVQRIASLRTADEVPVAVRTAFFPAARFPNLAEAVARHGAVTPALAEYGVTRFERRETRIGARIAGPRDAKLLNIAESAAVLVTDSVNVDSDGVPIETCQTRYPAERMTLTVPGAPEPD